MQHRFGEPPFTGAERGRGRRLARACSRSAPLDAPPIAVLADAWFPAPWPRLQELAPAPTIDLTVHFRAPLPLPDSLLLGRFRSRLVRDGFFEEDGELWAPDGTLVAQSRQLGLLLGAEGLELLHDADQLLVDELLDAVLAELAAEAGALDAAERQLGAVEADAVDVDHPGVEAVRDPLRLLGVVGEDVGAEPERGVVRQLDRLLLGADAVDARDRPEELLAIGVVVRGDPGQHGAREEVVLPLAADDDLRALGDRAVELILQRLRGGRRTRAAPSRRPRTSGRRARRRSSWP